MTKPIPAGSSASGLTSLKRRFCGQSVKVGEGKQYLDGTERPSMGRKTGTTFAIEPEPNFEDRYIRESMFGHTFGTFETAGCHFLEPGIGSG